jgi:glyoxylase-like metal-dependent hydrolase (beta-lactamase superfamily II)
MEEIKEYIKYIKSSNNPLSSNVFLIKGEKNNYIFDVGANKLSRDIIKDINNKIIIISHFHTDHMENMKYFINEKLYIGDYTYKILGYGNVVNDIIEINDGINLKIVHIPNSHAKGSLCLIVNDLYLLIGDSLEGNRYGLNVSLLYDEIKLLKSLNYKHILTSHDDVIYNKDEIIKNLEYYYSKREKNKPYIGYDLLT